VKQSLCWSCDRAYALPDPEGCGFHRLLRKKVFDDAGKEKALAAHYETKMQELEAKYTALIAGDRTRLLETDRNEDESNTGNEAPQSCVNCLLLNRPHEYLKQ